jgi:hypothetical protein
MIGFVINELGPLVSAVNGSGPRRLLHASAYPHMVERIQGHVDTGALREGVFGSGPEPLAEMPARAGRADVRRE